MPRVDFGKVPDSQNFEPISIGKYPVVLAVDNVQRDSQGNPLKDADGNSAIRHTKDGDEMWSIKATILDGKFIGRWISDTLSFGEKAVKRVKIVFSRAGIIEGDETHDCEPDELDGTYWWIEIGRHEARMNKDGTQKLAKNGKPIFDPRVAFAGYELMTPEDAKRYRENYQGWLAKKDGQRADSDDEGEANGDDVPF